MEKMEVMRRYISEAIFFAQTLTPKYARDSLVGIIEAGVGFPVDKCTRAGVEVDRLGVEDLTVIADGVLLPPADDGKPDLNAVDASRPGGRVWIRATRLDVPGQPGSWYRLQVVDEGQGIDAENLAKVFQPYFSTRDSGDGTRGFGLGLTMCEKIVDLHGGAIKIESMVGKGTTVTADLPIDPREESP